MNEYHDKDDSTLVQMTLLGNKSAFEELVARHERAVKGTAYNVTGCRFSAEDASQDAFVSAWMNLSALREKEKFGMWVCSIAKNHARTLTANYRSAIPNISLNEFESFDIRGAEDEDIFRYADLHEKIDSLSEKIREAIKLHYFDDLSIKEIAKELSISEGTVKWRLSEGRKQLRKGYGIMEKTYVENEPVVSRVMRQVEALKFWRIRDDKSGFEAEYRAVLDLVNGLPDSKEKSHALADTWLLGAWWLPGKANDEIFAQIKQAAEDGHNEDVMQAVAGYEADRCEDGEKLSFMLNTQVPYFKEKGFRNALGYTLFWLGFEYRQNGEYEKAVEFFKETMKVMPPENEYYANAKSAIYCETKVIEAKSNPKIKRVGIDATGEIYRCIDGKLYFWTQPGYDCFCKNDEHTSNLFWNMAACNQLILDPQMKLGDRIVSDAGCGAVELISTDETCQTPAGTFKNCWVLEFKGNRRDTTFSYCRTYLCKGIGIVRQELSGQYPSMVWELCEYNIAGGEGSIPFAEGNRWKYSLDKADTVAQCDREKIFEVTAFKNNTATVSSAACFIAGEYFDTFDGRMAQVTETYHDDTVDSLIDVREPLKRAKELAVTDYQKTYADVAEDVMLRILDSDETLNPDYTEKGRWNFFERNAVERDNGKVSFSCREHFEWKNTDNLNAEGQKLLYSFFDEIVDSCGMGVWSDEWVPGFTAKPNKPLKQFTVLDNETVTTPAGTFENCRHISFDLDFDFYFGGRSDCWYAQGIGFVKFTHKIDENTTAVWHLTACKGTGEGFFPTDGGLYRKYEPEAIGDGYRGALEYTFAADENGVSLFRNATGNQRRADCEKTLA